MSLADINFGIQNAATTKGAAQYVRFNQIFADGDLPKGQSIAATVGTQVVPLQMDVLSRYPDGSVKSAILTAALPPYRRWNDTARHLVGKQSSSRSSHSEQRGPGAGLRPHCQHEHLGPWCGDNRRCTEARISTGKWRLRGTPPGCACYRDPVRCSGHPRALRVTFDVVTHADGSVSTKVLFQNDSAMGSAGGAILFNNLSIVENGATRFSTTNLTQYQYQVWAQDVSQDSSARPTLNIRHDIGLPGADRRHLELRPHRLRGECALCALVLDQCAGSQRAIPVHAGLPARGPISVRPPRRTPAG